MAGMTASKNDQRIIASPLARRTAQQKGIDLKLIKGSGPRGRIILKDVENFKPSSSGSGNIFTPAPREANGMPRTRSIQNTTMRKAIARRLQQSKQQVPHFYLTVDCDLTALLGVRKSLNSRAETKAGKDNKPAYKLSVNDFVIKAVALALMDVPEANATWTDNEIKIYESADISVAVAIDGGLITPIIKDAQAKELAHISNEMKDLAARARKGELKPHEYEGGTFSISNLGMFGIDHFSAIINPPQGAILAVGAGVEKPVVKHGKIDIATVMTCTLSVDHRVVDGAVGAQFLQAFKAYIEDPVLLFAGL